ncbi:conjugative transposon TraK protein [Pedobacter africanus]|uniref:conjugative transposon protein TraK n=1 Tax=Pedobacter africanus TaxID=151894 RepID=UPI003392F973
MFRAAKNVDTAFKFIRTTCVTVIGGCLLITTVTVYKSYEFSKAAQGKIYVIANGKALEALSAERKDNVPIEARDHIKMFHHYFFTLSPDEKAIRENITKALYLADGSAKRQYDNLEENKYFSNMISGNVNQTIQVDSIQLDLSSYPHYFRCYAVQELTRPTSVVTRKLVTEGQLRNVGRSENNSHGFLIERWTVVENRDINIKNR